MKTLLTAMSVLFMASTLAAQQPPNALVALGGLAVATAQEPKGAGSDKQIAVDLGGSVKLKMVLIPSGEFLMGNGESAKDAPAYFNKIYGEDRLTAEFFKDEYPQHRVRITKPFYLGVYHVTRGQFRQFVADTAYKTDAETIDKTKSAAAGKFSWRNASFEQTDEHPVVCASWNDAVAFCKWLSGKEGKTYRLPTEAEWEYACRAGTTTRYYSGDDPETVTKVGHTAPVGKLKPNAFGLYDMYGNAWQWCADWYGAEYYAKSPVDDPTGSDSGVGRVLRGGSWYYWPRLNRSAMRLSFPPNYQDDLMGFRVARTQ